MSLTKEQYIGLYKNGVIHIGIIPFFCLYICKKLNTHPVF